MPGVASSRFPPRAFALAALACFLAGCSTSSGPLEMPDPGKRERAPGVEAVLTPVNGSGAQGNAKFVDRGGSLTVLVSINNVLPGTYRVAIHERGNCSSPNGFSAGKPWAPADSPRPAGDLLPEVAIGTNGNGQMATTLRGVRLTGPDSLEGRAVVVHAGSRVDGDVVPGVPNRLILCGALGSVRSFMDLFQN